ICKHSRGPRPGIAIREMRIRVSGKSLDVRKLALNAPLVVDDPRDAKFAIDLESHTFALIEIDQGEADIQVEVRAPDGTALGEFDSRERGPELVWISSVDGGVHTLKTRVREA